MDGRLLRIIIFCLYHILYLYYSVLLWLFILLISRYINEWFIVMSDIILFIICFIYIIIFSFYLISAYINRLFIIMSYCILFMPYLVYTIFYIYIIITPIALFSNTENIISHVIITLFTL